METVHEAMDNRRKQYARNDKKDHTAVDGIE
jgi:hypothetical protein